MLYSLAGSAIWHVCGGSLHAVSASWRLIRFRKPVSTSVRADSVLCAADLLVSALNQTDRFDVIEDSRR